MSWEQGLTPSCMNECLPNTLPKDENLTITVSSFEGDTVYLVLTNLGQDAKFKVNLELSGSNFCHWYAKARAAE